MIYNLINYSLEQKLYNYTLNQIDENLLEIILDDNKYYIVQRFKDQLIKDLQQKEEYNSILNSKKHFTLIWERIIKFY